MRLSLVLTLVAAVLVAFVSCKPTPPTPPPPPPSPPPNTITVVNMIPRSLSAEIGQDSEPFLALHPSDTLLMAASAFTQNPGGPASPTAPIFISNNGGANWTLQNIVPSQGMTGDITQAFDGANGDLYAGILRRPQGLLLNELVTADFLAPVTMTVQDARTQVDQPFVQATSVGGVDHIYVGNNDFAAAPRTATVDVSLDGGTTWTSVRIETRNTSGQDGPSIRPTIANDSTVYAAFFGWRSFVNSVASSDVVVVRDDNGGAGVNPFRALVGTDGQAGRRVVQNRTIRFSNAPTLGQERIGSTLSIAVQPTNSDVVYVGWADQVGNAYTIHVRRSTDRGQTWSNNDLRTLSNATNVALAVADDGTVGLLYQQVNDNRWETHLEQSRDGFTTLDQDVILANVPVNNPRVRFLPYLGDYAFLLAANGQFHGVFSASNIPNLSNFPQGVSYQRIANFNAGTLQDRNGQPVAVSIDPFYFRAPVVQ